MSTAMDVWAQPPTLHLSESAQSPDYHCTPIGPITTQMYSNGLRYLTNRTDSNLRQLQTKFTRSGSPCMKYGVKHWHPESRPESEPLREKPLSPAERKWLVMPLASDSKPEESKHMNTFCYFCSTMEEHQRHKMNDVAMKLITTKKQPRQRISYIAPLPTSFRKMDLEDDAKKKAPGLYKVVVFTGNKANSGTSANVYITLEGNRNILPRMQLKKSYGATNFTFQRSTHESFYVKGPRLGELECLTIEHDGLQRKHSWFLERVEVTDMKTKQIWIFVCDQWLTIHFGDHLIKRDLFAKMKEQRSIELAITVFTGKKRLGGTDANIFITIFGTDGHTPKIHLQDKSKKCFEQGSKDDFVVAIPSIGKMKRIRIEHDGSGFAPGWFLEKVLIRPQDDSRRTYYCLYNGWIASDAGDGRLWREIMAKTSIPNVVTEGRKIRYQITVLTGNVTYAGTDANVYIQMFGAKTSTKKLTIDDEKNNFEKGMTDIFELEAIDVGPLTRILLGHDNSGPGAGWYLEHVKIRRYLSKEEIVERIRRAKQYDKQKSRKPVDRFADDDDVSPSRRQRDDKRGSDFESEDRSTDFIARRKSGTPDRTRRHSSSTKRRESSMNKKGKVTDPDGKRLQRKGSSASSRRRGESSSSEDDSSTERGRKRKSKKKYRGISSDSDSSSSSSDDSEAHLIRKQRKTAKRHGKEKVKVQSQNLRVVIDKLTTLTDYKVPVYEEYEFVCKNWLAGDEGDGLLERELTATNMKTYYND